MRARFRGTRPIKESSISQPLFSSSPSPNYASSLRAVHFVIRGRSGDRPRLALGESSLCADQRRGRGGGQERGTGREEGGGGANRLQVVILFNRRGDPGKEAAFSAFREADVSDNGPAGLGYNVSQII